MDGDPIDNSHRILRYCRPSALNHEKSWPTAAAFARKVGHKNLSANDIDMFDNGNTDDRVRRSKELISKGQKMNKNGLLALVPVHGLRNVSADPALEVVHNPVLELGKENPFHCGILNVPTEEDLQTERVSVLEEIAGLVSGVWQVG